ncbi:sensor histidine kinase [Nonomuraea aurantiaca]|uniref:sensor histidine kinase n=1 Tax=Nonomuraea aurantiaca TaxID=2878562 RepID=UPI001CD9BBD5|nr:histidine kinase [Nonomuraea aurantiaca]MCA2221053.1 histidine kinase [Nonomuraea aurantiaca]
MSRLAASFRLMAMTAPWSRRADVVLAGMLAGLSFVPGFAHQGVDLADLPDLPLDAVGVLLILAQSLPLVMRRRWPAGCLAVVGGAFMAFQLLRYPTAFAGLGLIVALYSAGAHLRRRSLAVAVAVVAVVAYVGLAVALHESGSPERPLDYTTFLLFLVACWAAGVVVRERSAAEAERVRLAEAAVVAAERARIARELHDVVTHHVTAMVVQADAAQFLAGQPERVATGLAAISETGRHALTDLRYLLGALDGTPDADGEGREPSVGRLPDLVARTRGAGQPVELVEDGQPRAMEKAAEVAAYRVVQEALTNAVKHTAGERTLVHVRHGEEWMDVEVTTDGPSRPGLGRGGGRGLVGLRERVSVVGGELSAGVRSGGGFTVRARIPMGLR